MFKKASAANIKAGIKWYVLVSAPGMMYADGPHRRRDAEEMMEEIEESDASLEVTVVDYGEIRGMGLAG